MSMSSALSNAISGLGAASRSAQVVSSNISNALTPGYGRREVELASGQFGGVKISGISRHVPPGVIAERRGADAELGGASYRSGALDAIAGAVGTADDPRSLSGLVARFEGQLTEAASAPDAEMRQMGVVAAARDLVVHLDRATASVQAERGAADRGIAGSVDILNTGLARVEDLNKRIARASAAGEPVASLQDLRRTTIDKMSEIVPIREINRANGVVGLMTPGGQVLLDPSPVRIEFAPATAVTAETTIGNQLSGLSIGGRPIDMADPSGKMAGGKLAAMFEIRDGSGIAAQERLDGFARELVERFAEPAFGTAAGRASGAPGLFTDAGAAFTGADETGLAGRLRLNALVDPSQGGEVWRIRDGLDAATPGDVGDARLLNALGDALRDQRVASSDSLGPTRLGLGGQADTLVSRAAGDLYAAEDREAFTQTRAATLTEEELSHGVDTDTEMQKLLLVEQAYGANARVIQAVDEMMRRLMEL